MKTRLISIAAALAVLISPSARADEMVVIRNAKNSTARISKADLRELFTGKSKQWASGQLVQAAMGSSGAPDVAWLAAMFGVGESSFITKLKQEVFKGEMRKPIACGSDEECIAAVKANEGGLAVVSASAKLPAGVAVVEVN